MLSVDVERIKKYSVAGPRYTSYPPANHFTVPMAAVDVLQQINSASQDRPVSLYVHIPFCKALCWYCGCHNVITKKQSASARYLSYVEREMDMVAKAIHPERQVTQIHLGGGTPTFLQPDELRSLGRMMRAKFNVAADVESGVEIDPRTVTPEHIAAMKDAGTTRVSIGVQDFDHDVQEAIHRVQPFEMVEQVVRWIREAQFESFSCDLIYGLPNQNLVSFARTLDQVVGLVPNRISLFGYAHVPWIKPAQRLFLPESLPDSEARFALLKLAVETLTSNGYAYIGMDHFAKRGDELERAQASGNLQRNFQGYSTRGGADIYGFGVSSISQTQTHYWQNEKALDRYYEILDRDQLPITNGYVLNKDQRIRRETIMRLMCDMRLDYRAMSAALGVDFGAYFEPELESVRALAADGLVDMNGSGISVTESGRLLVRNIAMCFDNMLAKREGVYSRTI